MIELVSGYVFYEIAALLVLAAVVGFVGLMLRQPLIVSFIAAGILAGPSGLGIAQSTEYIDLLAELGIAILLFLVGLKLDLKLMRELGAVAVTTGLGQVGFTSLFGFMIALALGFDWLTSLYVAVALTFSSTIIIVKLLSDKKEIDALHGRVALGFLIVQDLVVVLAMIALSVFGQVAGGQAAGGEAAGSGGRDVSDALLTLVYGLTMLMFVLFFIRYLANPLVTRLARAPELLIAFAIGWAALLAALGHYLGFGKELGGLLAGISLASTPFREAIAARLASLRDFLLLFFFISLGAALDMSIIGENVFASVVFSLFVLIGNPLIVLAIMGAMGYRARTGFLAGLTVAQISEFSLIFMAMGLTLGHVTESGLGLVTLVGLITISASTYMITYSHKLWDVFGPFLRWCERRGTPRETSDGEEMHGRGPDVLIFGLGRYGGAIAQRLLKRGLHPLGVDFGPQTVRYWREAGLDVVYGDATDPEFVAHLPLRRASHAIAAMPEHTADIGTTGDPRIVLAGALREAGFRGRIAAVSHRETDREKLTAAGADVLLDPFQDAADRAVDLIVGSIEPERIEVVDPAGQETETKEV